MNEVTDNTKTLANALARIETLEAEKATLETEKAHLLKVIKARELSGYDHQNRPVYYISDEYDAAGILITPEVKL